MSMMNKIRDIKDLLLEKYYSEVEAGSVMKSIVFAFSMIAAASAIEYGRGIAGLWLSEDPGIVFSFDPVLLASSILIGFVSALVLMHVGLFLSGVDDFAKSIKIVSYPTVFGPAAVATYALTYVTTMYLGYAGISVQINRMIFVLGIVASVLLCVAGLAVVAKGIKRSIGLSSQKSASIALISCLIGPLSALTIVYYIFFYIFL